MFVLAALFLSQVCADPTKTIVGNAAEIPQLSTLVQVLTLPAYKDIYDALNSPGNYTLFAPNNNAFAAANINTSQTEFVSAVLLYHTLGARVNSSQLKDLQFPNTLSTDPTYVNIGRNVGQVLDVYKTNGAVFVNWGIPGVNNETAKVVQADISASNGWIHIIDRVALFPQLVSQTATEAGLTTLVQAVVKAGLVDTVDNTAKLTIFAPTNAAFAAVGGIDQFTPAQLTTILTYHVVPAVAYSTQLTNGEVLPTVNGGNVTVVLNNGGVQVKGAKNTANVVVANALTQNGAVHVIDAVLLPPSF